MTRNLEELIRAAQEHQAERSVPADRIRSALAVRQRNARRRRRLGMLAAGVAAAAVAAAVTVPVLALRDHSAVVTAGPGATAAPPAVPPASVPVAIGPDSVALGYRPGWLPAGFREHVRQTDPGQPGDALGPALVRTWQQQPAEGDPGAGKGSQLSLYVRTSVPDPSDGLDHTGETVDVNGARGSYSAAQGDRKSSVNWSPAPHTALILAAGRLEISRADLLKIARSVRPDRAVLDLPVRLAWVPPGWTAGSTIVSGPSAAQWRAQVFAARPIPEPSTDADRKKSKELASGGGDLSVTVGTTTDAPDGGASLTVNGRPARNPVRTDTPGAGLIYLVVDLGAGRLMTLIGQGLTLDEVKRVAARVEITPAGLGWIGR